LGWLHLLLDSKIPVFRYILYFAIYSGIGWVVEAIYRSFRHRRFVNAGFLRGPFLPIYGMGATCVLLLAPTLRRFGLGWELFAFGVVLTAIEYAVGTACEKIFGLRMWDYSEDRLNFQGRICLPYSALWASMAVVFERWIHPRVARVAEGIPTGLLEIIVPILLVYFVLDFAGSLNLLRIFVGQLSRIHLRRRALSHSERGRLADSFGRFLSAFPNLQKYLDAVTGLRHRLDDRRSELQTRFLRFVESRSPREEEFRAFVRDIAVHPQFLRTKEFRHHDSSIFRHSLRVAFLSYSVGRFLHLDARAMARGGLLHDFFLYDWRDHDLPQLAKEKFHGFEHPAIAVRNAEMHFRLSPVERDIIARHMWPLTPRPPGGLESFFVSCVDKHVALREFRAARKPARGQNQRW
jgi:uncharacterized membrane protein